jgi:hypothetical protein
VLEGQLDHGRGTGDPRVVDQGVATTEIPFDPFEQRRDRVRRRHIHLVAASTAAARADVLGEFLGALALQVSNYDLEPVGRQSAGYCRAQTNSASCHHCHTRAAVTGFFAVHPRPSHSDSQQCRSDEFDRSQLLACMRHAYLRQLRVSTCAAGSTTVGRCEIRRVLPLSVERVRAISVDQLLQRPGPALRAEGHNEDRAEREQGAEHDERSGVPFDEA